MRKAALADTNDSDFKSHYLDIEHSPLAISSGLRIYCTPNVLSRAELGGNH